MQQSHIESTHASMQPSSLDAPGSLFRWAPREPSELPVRVQGALPEWLRGKLVRVAPALFDRGSFTAEHWFDGHGLVYGFELGSKPRYQQHLLESRALAAAEAGRADIATFDTRMHRRWFERLRHPIPEVTDNANVNVIPWQGAWLAMTETPYQHVIDPESLRTRGLYSYDDDLPRRLNMTAHPHYDTSREALVNVGFNLGAKSEIVVYRQSWSSHRREVEGRLSFRRLPYVHSFGLTPNYAVLLDHPWRVNPMGMLFSERGIASHFVWEPRRGTRMWKLDRRSGDFTAYETDAFFCFHTVNTFEDGGDVVCDFLAYDDASLVRRSRREFLSGGPLSELPRLVRARLSPGAKRARLEQLTSARFEFPQIAYRQKTGRSYGHVWGAALKQSAPGQAASEILHVELTTDRTRTFSEPEYRLGEPVFVARPGARSETDGVLLSVGSHVREERSALVVLDADRLELLARCEVDVAIPLGFHGNFAFEFGSAA
jgi:beta,beta-carotene 9',10'-dioxygenase